MQPLAHGGVGVLGMLQHVGDLTHLGLHAGAHHDPFSAAIGHHAGREGHVVAVTQRHLTLIQ